MKERKKVFITEFEHDLHGLEYESYDIAQGGALYDFVMDVQQLSVGDLIMFCGDFYTLKSHAQTVKP